MKRKLILFLAIIIVIILTSMVLVGCVFNMDDGDNTPDNTPDKNTIEKTPVEVIESSQKAWSDSKDKIANDKIIIKGANIANLIYNIEATIELERTFKNDVVTANFKVGNIILDFSDSFKALWNAITNTISSLNFNLETIKKEISNFSFVGTLVFNQQTKVLNGNMAVHNIDKLFPGLFPQSTINELENIKIGHLVGEGENAQFVEGIEIGCETGDEFADANIKAIDLLLSHFGTTLFKPSNDGTGILDFAQINAILKDIVFYSNLQWNSGLDNTIQEITGVDDYQKLLEEKLTIITPIFEGKVENDVITEMTWSADNIQLMYNITELEKLFLKLFTILEIQNNGLTDDIIKLIFQHGENITDVHCVEIGEITLTSKYLINE